MAKQYTVNKGAALIFNLIIAAVCAVSVIAYFLFPLWNVKIGYTMNAEQVKQIMGSEDETANEIVNELAKEGVSVTLAVTLQTNTFLSSFSKDGNELIEDIIDYNVDNLVKELSATTKGVTRAAVRVAAKIAVKEALGEGVEFKDEQNVETQLNAVADALTAENATVESVTDAALTAMENIYTVETGGTISEEDKEKCRAEIENALKNVADEEGNIDLDSLAADLLAQALKNGLGGENKTPADEPSPAGETAALTLQPRVSPVSFTVAAEGEEESGAAQTGTEEIKTLLKEKVNETLTPATMQKIQLVLKIVAGVILFTFFTWAWVVLKILFKLTSDNPMVKLKLPILLGWLPFLALYVLPKVGMTLLAGQGGAEFAGLTLAVSSCSVVSAIAALALIVISIPYHALKKRV